MALTKTTFAVVPLHSFEHVSRVVCDAISHTSTSSITVTCSDVSVRVAVVSHPQTRVVHVRRYAYEWGATKEKQHALWPVPGPSEGLQEVGDGTRRPEQGLECRDPTPEELAAFLEEEETP